MKLRTPVSWLPLMAWIGGAVLLSTIAVGFADCISESNTCTKEPCWGLWLHCAYKAISAPIVVVFNAASSTLGATLIAVLGGGAVAHWLWKLQSARKARHDAALTILTALQSLGDAIMFGRDQLEPIAAFRRGLRFLSGPSDEIRRNPQHAAQRFGLPVWQAHEQLKAAEVAARDVISDTTARLKPVYLMANVFMRQFYAQWNPNITPEEGESLRRNSEKWGERLQALYPSKENDHYARELETAMRNALDYFRGHLVDPGKGRR